MKNILILLGIYLAVFTGLAGIGFMATGSAWGAIGLPVTILLARRMIKIIRFAARKKQLENSLGPEALVLITADGFTFRDLNKNGKLDIYEDPRQPIEKRVEDLLSQMTLEEKAGLMFSPMMGAIESTDMSKEGGLFKKTSVLETLVGKKVSTFACLGTATPAQFARWNNAFQKLAERTRLGIPVTLCSDPRHNYTGENNPLANLFDSGVSQWPTPLGLAATRDEALVTKFGQIARQELRHMGVRFALHPVADLATEPRWPRIQETFGEDAELSGRMTVAYVKGFQGENINQDSVACCIKHFPGGGPQKDGDDPHCYFGMDQVYPGNNFNYHLKPFAAAFQAGAAAIMPYYARPKDVPGLEEVGFSFNRNITHDLLRNEMGFKGIVHSDYGLISDLRYFGFNFIPARAWGVEKLNAEERVLKAVNAGVDQLGGESCSEILVDLVRQGKLPEERLDDSCRRILNLKFRLGLFDDPYVDPDQAAQICGNAEFIQAGEDAMRKSLVLLKKDHGGKQMLPLSGKPKVYVEGFDLGKVAQFAEPVKDIKAADFALVRLEVPYRLDLRDPIALMFKGRDLDYTKKQKMHLAKIMGTCPTIVSIKLLRPAVIPEIAEQAAGIIGDFGAKQHILLEAIFGSFSPSGKLPFEMPRSMEAVRAQRSDVPFDSKDPLFPFGFGLTY